MFEEEGGGAIRKCSTQGGVGGEGHNLLAGFYFTEAGAIHVLVDALKDGICEGRVTLKRSKIISGSSS